MSTSNLPSRRQLNQFLGSDSSAIINGVFWFWSEINRCMGWVFFLLYILSLSFAFIMLILSRCLIFNLYQAHVHTELLAKACGADSYEVDLLL